MKTIIATFVLVSLMLTTAAWAGKNPEKAKLPDTASFDARISNLHGDTLTVTVVNPDRDKVVVKVFSDRNLKVLQYTFAKKEVARLNYLMEDMRHCTYTAVVERNQEVVLRKEIELN